MTKLLTIICFSGLLALLLTTGQSCYYDNEEDLYGACDTVGVSYSAFVRPLMLNQCTPGCHSGAQPTGNLDFTQYVNAQTAALDGRLYNALTRTTDRMPKNGTPLDDCTLRKIDAWIKAGAPNN